MPTGFWDRQPQRSPGRLRRVLAQGGFPQDFPLDGRIREKHSVTAHLPKGVQAHRRQKAPPGGGWRAWRARFLRQFV